MARQGVQYEEVVSAIHQCLDAGITPTLQRLREQLGTGSFSTLSEHLKRWKAEQAQQPEAAKVLPTRLIEAAQVLWQRACEESEAQRMAYQTELNQQLESARLAQQTAEQQAQETTQYNLRLEEKNTQLLAKLEAQAMQLGEIQQQCQQQQQQISLLEQALQDAQTQMQQQLITLTSRHEADQQHWLQELDHARQALRDVERKKEAQEQAHQQAQAQRQEIITRYQQEVAHSQAMIQLLQTQREQARQEQQQQLAQLETKQATREAQIKQEWRTQEVAWQYQYQTLQEEKLKLQLSLAQQYEQQVKQPLILIY